MSNPYVTLLQQGIFTIKASSATTVTTTSATDAVLSGMTLTPVAGSYLAIFVGSISENTGGNVVTTSFYINGVQDAASIMPAAPFAGGALAAGSSSISWVTMGGPYTVNGSQAIALNWHVNGGTSTALNRQLFLIKTG